MRKDDMKNLALLTRLLPFLLILLLAGCAASSDQSATNSAPPASAPSGGSVPAPARTDTVNVAVQKEEKPAYETTDPVKTSLPATTVVKFCVQIGAYKQQDNAGVIASVAKSRFARNIYTIHDAATELYKVMIGDFGTKDEARVFRDRMVQQYPGDYKDAWVSELAQ